MVLAACRILQVPLANLVSRRLLILIPLSYRDLVFIDQIGIEIDHAHRLLVELFSFGSARERTGGDEHHLCRIARR